MYYFFFHWSFKSQSTFFSFFAKTFTVFSPRIVNPIAKHQNPRDIYAARLLAEGVISEGFVKELETEYKASLEEELEDSRKEKKTVITPFMEEAWKGFKSVQEKEMMKAVDTTFDKKKLTQIAKTITELPEGKKFLRKVERLVGDRKKMFFETDKLDWAMGELLAYGSLLTEGFGVRYGTNVPLPRPFGKSRKPLS